MTGVPAPAAHDGERPCFSFAQLSGADDVEGGTALLWLINRAVFHPRGYALALHFQEAPDGTTDPNPVGWSIQASGDGTPWMYGDEQYEDRAFALVEQLLAQARAEGSAPQPGR